MGSEISTATLEPDGTGKFEQASVLPTEWRRSVKMKMLQDDQIIWVDENITDNNRDYHHTLTKLQRIVNSIGTFTDGNECIHFIQSISHEKVNLIVSGSLGEHLVPKIHEMFQVKSIFIFCFNSEHHKQWTKKWSKIKGVFTGVVPMCEAIIEFTKQNSIDIRLMSTDDHTPSKALNQLHYSFMYTQILKEILLSIEFKPKHIQNFINYCREIFADNAGQLHHIQDFEHNYFEKTPIWWYTSECFLYRMLNSSLRTMDVDIIVKMGFFTNDLHRHIEKLHSEQFNTNQSNRPFVVYRGQGLSKKDFEQIKATKGGLMSFNQFLSTSKQCGVSFDFARRALRDADKVGIFFVMTIDPSQSIATFASITDVSRYQHAEDEVLFSMHTVFRTHDIKPMDESNRLFRIELTLTRDDDKDLRLLTDCIREETNGLTGWYRLRSLLLKLGESTKAQEVDGIILDQRNKQRLNHQTASNKDMRYDEKSSFLRQQSLPSPSHTYSIDRHKQSATVHFNMSVYSKALFDFEKVLQIQQQFLPSNHPDLATSFHNIGNAYNKMSQFSKALSYYGKALKIQQQSLPPYHLDLGMSYNNIGVVNKNMGDYSNAFLYYKRAIDVGQHSLPPDHSLLKQWRKNLAYVDKRCHMSMTL